MNEPKQSPADALLHDLRNVLSALVNATEILKRGQKLDADGRKAVATIDRQTQRLLELAEELQRIRPKG